MSYLNYQTKPGRPGLNYLVSLCRYRSLSANLVASDLRARFRRSRLGIIWAVLQPLAYSIMIALVWGALFQQSFLTFAIYVLSGLVVWEYFVNVVMASQDSLILAEGHLKQSRIPLLVFQMRPPLSGSVTFLAGVIALVSLQASLGDLPPFGLPLLQIFPFCVLLILFLMPIAIIFSLLGTQFRDLRHATLIVINGLFFMSPIMLDREYLNAPHLQWLQYANPIIPLLDVFRSFALYGEWWKTQELIILGIWIFALWIAATAISAAFGRKIIFAI